MKKTIIAVMLSTFAIASCTKIDHIDDAIVPQKIVMSVLQVALKPAESSQLNAEYYNEYGVKKQVAFLFTSSKPTVAQIDNTGKITALAVGSAVVQATYGNILGPLINVNVVANDANVAIVTVTAPTIGLSPNSKVQLTAVVKNINGGVITGKTVEWYSENSSIMTVTPTGEATALTTGVVGIHAKVDGVKSNSIDFTVSNLRTGSFVRAGGYEAKGLASLGIENGRLLLKLGTNFETSFALGTFVYLANSTNGSNVRSGGLEVSQISTNGAKTFDITAAFPNVGINDYKYVIILCKPASVTFGYAELN